MNVVVDAEDEVNLIKDVRARSNACYKCGEMGHFQRDCKYDDDKPSDSKQEQEGTFDSYNPVVGKWMTNLVATTPITAKAMKDLYAELNRQKKLKRTYRRWYKDLQAVVATSTDTLTTTVCPTVAISNKATSNIQNSKPIATGPPKKIPDKGKMKPINKGEKSPVKSMNVTTISSTNLCSHLKDKAKHTADSDATRVSDLEQEDTDIPLTEDEQ